jgi:uncharacterized protein YjiS (DUF1127 family)
MQNRGEQTMGAHTPVQSERLAPDHCAGEDWPRIDPAVLVAEGSRLQARARVEAILAGWRGLRRSFDRLVAAARYLWDLLARRSERNRAVYQLSGLDDRLLADIGLRRGDIELAVDGLLANSRVRRRAPMVEQALDRGRRPLPAVTADRMRSASTQHVPDLAA